MVQRYDLMKEYHADYLSFARKDFEKHVNGGGQQKGRADPYLRQ